MKNNNKDVALRLREARKRAGYKSARSFAAKNSLTLSSYRHHENGTRGISIDQATHYSALLGIHPAWLMTGIDYDDVTHQEHLTENDIALAASNFAPAFGLDEELQKYLFKALLSLSPYLVSDLDRDYAIGTLIETYKTCISTEKNPAKRLDLAKNTIHSLEGFLKQKAKVAI